MKNSIAILSGIIAGVIAARLVMSIPIEFFENEPVKPNDRESLKAYFGSLHVLVSMLVSHAVGCIVAGGIVTVIGQMIRWVPSALTGIIFIAMVSQVIPFLPNPAWIVGDILIILVFAFVGEWLGRRIKGESMFARTQIAADTSDARVDTESEESANEIDSETDQ